MSTSVQPEETSAENNLPALSAAKKPSNTGVWITVIIGVAIILAFGIASIVSYSNASSRAASTGTEQHWTFWWGPMAFGLVVTCSALAKLNTGGNSTPKLQVPPDLHEEHNPPTGTSAQA